MTGETVDFVDGVVFSAEESYLTLGTWANEAPSVSDYTGQEIYYRSIQQKPVDHLTARDLRSISFMPSLTRTPFHLVFLDRSDRAAVASSTLQLGSDYLAVYDMLCLGVSRTSIPRNAYSDASNRRVAHQYLT